MNEGPMSLFSEVSSEGSEETESTRPLKSADEINEWFVEGLQGVKLKDAGFYLLSSYLRRRGNMG